MSDAMPHQGLGVRIAGHYFIALPERALYWPEQKMVMIADLHIGKADIFRASGIAVPQSVQAHDLSRLGALLCRLRPRTLVILGDFLHGAALGKESREEWQALRRSHPATRFVLTRGNHDRNLQEATLLLDEISASLLNGNVLLSHVPSQRSGSHGLNIHGHIHPIYRARGWNRGLPAMVLNGSHLVLPAFSAFTGGVQCHSVNSRVWVFVSGNEPIVMRVQ